MSTILQDLHARVEIVNFLNAVQHIDHYYIETYYTPYQIHKRRLARYTHKDQCIPDAEILTEIHDLGNHLGDLFSLYKRALKQLDHLETRQ